MKKIASITFGCKVNQYETSCIVDEFTQAGYQITEFDKPADVYIINTCTVTNRTDYKSRNAIRKALNQKQINPEVKVVVTGCYSQRKKKEIEELGEVDLIIDNNSKSKIFEKLNSGTYIFRDIKDQHNFDEISTTKMLDKTRAFIKIQDGCDYYCAYCAIPYARGHSRSRKKNNILNQIKKLVDNGYKEFVLGGINLGLYGAEFNYSLAKLLYEIEKINGVKLIRLSSIEPQLFTDELLEYFTKSKKMCHHFHIPLQVGCDELLNSMGRRYTIKQFQDRIMKIRAIFLDVAIGIDVIAGLPGETEELFKKTHQFLSNLDFTYLHVFSYSNRSGTRAEKMKGHVNGKIIKKRSNELISISIVKLAEYTDFIIKNNIELKGIIEKRSDGYWTALSDHYVRIYVKSEENIEKKYLHLRPVSKKYTGIKVEII
ncbi:MAG: tRNA (N(6)-L-threonylcarbamoyladenosine(37)-C(2))-methylthiotransferase MtaB [Candidatus Tenebribacter burtonii]|jgi:threonylcarbamoyladenosine tRNA methylthiotransferase MtaB|nr:tRNA (N(6)-L-threonylcarbamoyladenosine(37)-C(2))-methylthiotransferase MtaB [Candidatus Tenebribacter burtonii]